MRWDGQCGSSADDRPRMAAVAITLAMASVTPAAAIDIPIDDILRDINITDVTVISL
ncbi:hypothetical protein GCM10020219_078010 [Nonomuraea dietziae]